MRNRLYELNILLAERLCEMPIVLCTIWVRKLIYLVLRNNIKKNRKRKINFYPTQKFASIYFRGLRKSFLPRCQRFICLTTHMYTERNDWRNATHWMKIMKQPEFGGKLRISGQTYRIHTPLRIWSTGFIGSCYSIRKCNSVRACDRVENNGRLPATRSFSPNFVCSTEYPIHFVNHFFPCSQCTVYVVYERCEWMIKRVWEKWEVCGVSS